MQVLRFHARETHSAWQPSERVSAVIVKVVRALEDAPEAGCKTSNAYVMP